MQKTRFPELGYTRVCAGLWRIVDAESGAHIGPQYRTRAELLADLERYASVYGCAQPVIVEPDALCAAERVEVVPGWTVQEILDHAG